MQAKFLSTTPRALLTCLCVLLTSCGFSDGFSGDTDASNNNQQSTPAASVDSGVESGNTTLSNTSNNNNNTENTGPNDTALPPFELTTNGILGFDDLSEASGLAASRLQQDLLWAIADSGNSPELFAMNDDGSELGRISLAVSNRDWEELAAFTLNGEHFLLVADTGDNLRQYASYPLYIVAEPQGGTDGPLQPLVTLTLSYTDGAHDVEALAVAEFDGNLYLVTKDETPGVYAAPLFATLTSLSGDTATIAQQSQAIPITATRIGDLTPPQQTATDSFLGMLAGVNLGNVTAMDIDNARSRVWLLTYRGIYLVQATGNETIGQALTRQATLISRHSLGQAESLAYSSLQDAVFVTSEGRAATILRLLAQ